MGLRIFKVKEAALLHHMESDSDDELSNLYFVKNTNEFKITAVAINGILNDLLVLLL